MNWRELMRCLTAALHRGQIPDPEREALYLLQWATGQSYAHWVVRGGCVGDIAVQRAWTGLGRRLAREPLAYITGHQEFYGLDLVVNPAVLIPRAETEILVETVLDRVQQTRVTAVDVGCGSGAIALALQSVRPAWVIYGADISVPALQVATRNAERLKLPVQWVQSDLLLAVPRPIDVIAANLPYVDPDEVEQMSLETRYEPSSALFAENHGLALIHRLVTLSLGWLRDAGQIFLECSPAQTDPICQLLETLGFQDMLVVKDYAGLDRVVCGTRT